MNNKYFLNYEKAFGIGAEQVGWKAFNLLTCRKAGFRVPDGVIVHVTAFLSYLHGENLEHLFDTIEKHFSDTGILIVRSSALKEDTPDASYAGQYLTLVCNNSSTEIKKACEACWSACFSSNIDAYSTAMQVTDSDGKQDGMALLVQRLVKPASAGVCFTKDPQRESNQRFVINAVRGLGEALVNGEVVSDHYEFDIRKKCLVRQITGRQTQWLVPEYPRDLKPLPEKFLGQPVLSPAQVEQIALTAQKVSELFHNHLDIEWAYEGDELFLLQVRPISQVRNKSKFELWTRDNVADVIPDAVTPMTWSVVKDATNSGFKKSMRALGFPHEPADLFRIFDGRVYFNQTEYQKLLNISPETIRGLASLLKIAVKYLRQVLFLKKEVVLLEDAFQPGLERLYVYQGAASIIGLKNYLDKYMAVHIRIAILMELGFLVIRKVINKHIPKDQRNAVADGLVTGLNKIDSTAFGDALWDLAGMVKQDKDLVENILSSPEQSIPEILKKCYGPIADQWLQFLDSYGYSSLKEFEIYYPRWIEDPGFIIRTIKQYVGKDINNNQESSKKIRAEKRMQAEKILLKEVPLIYHPILKFYINHIQQCSIRRESIKQKLVIVMAQIRKQVLSFADEYVIEPEENVFFLILDEISQIKYKPVPSQLLKKSTSRKKEWEEWKIREPYKEVRAYAEGYQIKVPYFSGSGNVLKGMALCSGTYTGPARIIINPSQVDSFNQGDILVTKSTNPSWTPLFILAGAIVTDVGNYLSHGAIVARELGIPAVGNLFDATKRIKSGQIICVDGDSGTVYLT